jgi:hypothetical protein
MICPKCKELGQKSIIHRGLGTATSMYCPPYYDEEGVYHSHDANICTTVFNCSKGHRITIRSTGKCPSCVWGHDSQQITVEDIGPQTFNLNGGDVIKFT